MNVEVPGVLNNREKIRNQSYTPEEANYWIKEINNLLQQIIKKNPNMTLEEILHEMGRHQRDIDRFLAAVRNTHLIAAAHEGTGVNPATVKMLEGLMKTLGVTPWY